MHYDLRHCTAANCALRNASSPDLQVLHEQKEVGVTSRKFVDIYLMKNVLQVIAYKKCDTPIYLCFSRRNFACHMTYLMLCKVHSFNQKMISSLIFNIETTSTTRLLRLSLTLNDWLCLSFLFPSQEFRVFRQTSISRNRYYAGERGRICMEVC